MKKSIAITLNNEIYDIVKRRAMENGLTIARFVEDRVCVELAAVKHASNVGWLGAVIGHANGELEIHFTDGRSVDAIELLNQTMECLTVAKLLVKPGDALVFHTSTPNAPRVPILQGPPQDEAGIYSNVYRRWATSPSWELLFRCAGSISDETVRQCCGVGIYRISVHHNLSLAVDMVLSTREVTVYAECTRLEPEAAR